MAYADFVTAMMALFMVLWIISQDEEILEATSDYFKNPFSSLRDRSGLMREERFEQRIWSDPHDGQTAAMVDLQFLRSLASDLYRMLNIEAETDQSIDIQVTSDGLRIVIYNRRSQPFFERESDRFTEWGDFVIRILAWIVERHNFTVVIDGHVANGSAEYREDFGPWELTAGRANAARRALERYAVRPDQIERVSGYGDTVPLPAVPFDAEMNDRIALSLKIDPHRSAAARNASAAESEVLQLEEKP